MELTLNRLKDNGKTTIGELIVGDLRLVTCEDTYRSEKVWGQTRIPAGTYEIKLRTEGKFHSIYSRRMPHHKGMLWLQDVPGYEYILIHVGNTSADSAGCILVGMEEVSDDRIGESTVGYIRLYAYVIDALNKREKVIITINDEKSTLLR
jgi:hypothetical protein